MLTEQLLLLATAALAAQAEEQRAEQNTNTIVFDGTIESAARIARAVAPATVQVAEDDGRPCLRIQRGCWIWVIHVGTIVTLP